MSKGHQVDTGTCPVGGLVVLTTFNHLKLKLDTADSEFLKNNSGKHITESMWCLKDMQFFFFIGSNKVISEGRLQA